MKVIITLRMGPRCVPGFRDFPAKCSLLLEYDLRLLDRNDSGEEFFVVVVFGRVVNRFINGQVGGNRQQVA